MKNNVVAFASGALFAAGLAISGMTHPSKVLGFLDFGGDWDPSLAFVMAGAIAVHFVAMRWASGASAPLFADRFQIPPRRDVDASLVAGAAMFGVGWGLAGYCPGPAVTSVGALSPITLTFVASMLAGMLIFAAIDRARASGVQRVASVTHG
jgi:uncharacterized membrane protein YedE/YeeE